MRKTYSGEYKRKAAALVLEGEFTVKQVYKDLNYTKTHCIAGFEKQKIMDNEHFQEKGAETGLAKIS